MSELSLFKKMLLIRDCNDPKKLKRHIKYWDQKVENLANYTLESEKDKIYVVIFKRLVEFATARLEFAQAKLEGRNDETNTIQEL